MCDVAGCKVCPRLKERTRRALGLNLVSPDQQAVWTPENVTQGEARYIPLDGGKVDIYTFTAKYRDRTAMLRVVKMADTSAAQVEDMVAMATERWEEAVNRELDEDGDKPKPTPEQRVEIGAILNDIRHYQAKRTASGRTRKQTVYEGVSF